MLIPTVIAVLLIAAAAFWSMRHFASPMQAPTGAAIAIISTEPAGAMVVLDDQMERSPATFRESIALRIQSLKPRRSASLRACWRPGPRAHR